MKKLIDDIIETILDDVNCHHEVDHDEGGSHSSVEYDLYNEVITRETIRRLIQEKANKNWDNARDAYSGEGKSK